MTPCLFLCHQMLPLSESTMLLLSTLYPITQVSIYTRGLVHCTCTLFYIYTGDFQLQKTSFPKSQEGECTCKCSSSAVIAVSAVSLLLIVTLTTVLLTQCLLIIRLRRSRTNPYKDTQCANNDIYEEVIPMKHLSSLPLEVPLSPNEAYALPKITRPQRINYMVK